MNYIDDIKEYFKIEIDVLNKMDPTLISQMMSILFSTWDNEGTIYIFGNGGSAATASHFQNDFNKGLSEHLDKKFHFHCLNDNIATIMAIANDIGYDEIFRFQLKNVLKPNDLIIAISGSGNSANVINAVEYAKEKGITTIGLVGYNGGKLKEMVDLAVHVPINSMQITEDIHMIFDHLIMAVFYKHLCHIEHLRK